jgi:protein phosphatase
LVRSENQDAYGCFPEKNSDDAEERLFIVADGMGGHMGGKEASRIALAEVPRVFFGEQVKTVHERLQDAFAEANERIYEKAQEGNGFDRMGTTCTALVVKEGEIFIAHVGDTRAYRIDQDEIELLTADHTLVEEMRREGVLTEAEARTHPRRNTLTRAMGVEPNLNVDVYDIGSLKSDHRYLLCSDGLSEVTREELKRVVLNLAPQNASDRLVEMANERGGHDNVTVLVLQVL